MFFRSSRRRRISAVVTGVIMCAAVAGGTQQAHAQAADVPLAPELTGLGTLRVPVATLVPRAQRFFDQGMRLLYAFNHTEAIRAFREAARLDPGLAMAYWGQALALGPNLNAPMTLENGRLAYAAIQQAMKKTSHLSSRERALIKALARRYEADGAGDRAALNRAYAAAMETVAARFAGDPDVATLYADARMNTMPWDYWQKDGSPKPETAEVLAMLESIIEQNPDHPGALHYHIHVLEASADPDRAERSADRLGSLMPAAGHMVHMPAHIYIRVGRYADAAEANELAIRADEDYLSQCQAQGLYPVSYYPHNLHFLWAAATLEGRQAVAVEAARKVAAKVPHHHAGALAWTADFPVTPMLAYARFGLWQEALTEPRPPAMEPYATGIWHYARGRAFIARDQLDRAASELTALKNVMQHEAFASTLKDLPLLTNLQIASRVVEGELAARREDADTAIRVLREAVAIEDGLPYSEPPIWHQPTRHVLGAVLLEAGRPTEAEEVYRQDLKVFRENGWSLFGLMESLKAQLHRSPEVAEVERRFEKAWRRSDVTLTSSREAITPEPPN
jgi:tetratricopeptide (TPR) repeat protein